MFHRTERVELSRALYCDGRLLVPAHVRQNHAQVTIRKGITGIEGHGSSNRSLRRGPVPFQPELEKTQRDLHLDEVAIRAHRLADGIAGSWPHLQRGRVAIDRTCAVPVHNPGPRERVVRVDDGGLRVALDGPSRCRQRALVGEVTPPEIEVVRLGVSRLPSGECAQTLGRQPQPDLLGEGGADFLLEGEQAGRLTFVELRPDCSD